MLDRLRESALNDDYDDEPEEVTDYVRQAAAEEDLLLGLNPAQRLVLSLFLFLDVAVIGFMLLLALGRINI
ncbi:MAG: hypothetical protein M5R40_09535 [Anaerolineae bacterium]|nr:hypothetical protein [Anaerolineae bacterium]